MTRLVDLSHTIRAGLVTYPGLPAPRIEPFLTREASRANYAPGTQFAMDVITLIGNTGTYIDSPFHRYEGGTDLAGLSLETLVDQPAEVFHLRDVSVRGIPVEPFRGHDLRGRAVLLDTGWSRHFGTPAYASAAPFLTGEAAEYLVGAGVTLVGIDSLNIDDVESGGERPAHSVLLAAGIHVVEHLTDLHELPARGSTITVVPPRRSRASAPFRCAPSPGFPESSRPLRVGDNGDAVRRSGPRAPRRSRKRAPMEPVKVRAPSIRDVARIAGVSYQTVSRALNNSENIRATTKDRVLEVIEQLGYRPNQAARALVTSRSRTIGVLTSQVANYGPATSLAAIEEAARDAGYVITTTSLTATDSEAIHDRLEYLLSQAIEGLVVIAPQMRVFNAIRELDIRLPLVTLDSTGRDGQHSLAVDQMAGARLATRHLIDLGHRHIVHLAGPQDWIEAEARMAGFLDEIIEADLDVRAPILGDWTSDFGYTVGRELARYRDFTAVFAANDLMALGLIHAFRDAGLDVPGDVSVVGFDDVPEARHYLPPLTTVRQDFAEIGRRSVAMLLSELDGHAEHSRALILPELVVRESTAPPRS